MPNHKSLKTLFMETVLFISLVALVGHLSVNFWERYVIQNELTKMKTSLHNLKGTINNIGVAYDQLHNELKTLAVIADHPYTDELEPLGQKNGAYPQRKLQTTINAYVQSSFARDEKKIDVKPSTRNKNEKTSIADNIAKTFHNATTYISPNTRNVNIQKCTHGAAMTVTSRHSKVDRYVDKVYPLVNKYIQYSPNSYSNVLVGKDAATRTRYPLKSTGSVAKPEYPGYNPKTRPTWFNRSSPISHSRYHEKCHPDPVPHRFKL